MHCAELTDDEFTFLKCEVVVPMKLFLIEPDRGTSTRDDGSANEGKATDHGDLYRVLLTDEFPPSADPRALPTVFLDWGRCHVTQSANLPSEPVSVSLGFWDLAKTRLTGEGLSILMRRIIDYGLSRLR